MLHRARDSILQGQPRTFRAMVTMAVTVGVILGVLLLSLRACRDDAPRPRVAPVLGASLTVEPFYRGVFR